MIFSQPVFFVFLAALLGVYTLCQTQTQRAVVLLTGSLIFYASWKPAYLILLVSLQAFLLVVALEGIAAHDPVLARSARTGTIFLATLSFNTAQNLWCFRSTDNGASFLSPATNLSPGFTSTTGNQDKEWIAVDNNSTGGQPAGFGNVYHFWRNFGSTPGMTFTRSTDDGLTFGDVYFGTDLPEGTVFEFTLAAEPVDVVAARREHQDRRVALAAAQAATDLQAVHARQHHVQHHQVVAAGLRFTERGDAVVDERAVAADLAELQRHQPADVDVVLDHEHAPVHVRRSAAGGLAIRATMGRMLVAGTSFARL